ncbi:MAG: Gordonia phage [Actinomycetota bacterium]
MSEIALRETTTGDPTGGRLVAWAASLSAAHQIGTALCSTTFVPQHFRNKPEEAAAAILYGDEIGLTPTQSLQSVYVVSGKPALYARAMVAIVLAAGHEVETIKKTDAEVTVRGRRRGSSTWITETWTTARAKKAGYLSNKKYDSDPQAMLYARAASDVCRQVAPDALAGIGYSVEEMEMAEAPAKTVVTRAEEPEAKPTSVRRRSASAAPSPVEPPLDDEPVIEEAVEEPEVVDAEVVEEPPVVHDVEMMNGPQSKMMGALMRDLGITTRDGALTYCTDVIRRDITSRNELTKAEAIQIIDALNADKAAQDAFESLGGDAA